MATTLILKTMKKCVLCKHFNGAVGSTTIQPKMGGQFAYEHNEKQSCFKKNMVMNAWATCTGFDLRYK
ncbi:MAG: hypothetical protein IJA12_07560 [Oscillospiraceae bacterium]|nr:hypothetical protein [Oscillospiraceae bacterium]